MTQAKHYFSQLATFVQQKKKIVRKILVKSLNITFLKKTIYIFLHSLSSFEMKTQLAPLITPINASLPLCLH